MKTKREETQCRDSDRRSGRDGSVRNNKGMTTDSASSRRTRTRAGRASASSREARGPKSGPQTSPIPWPAERPARPKNTSQAKARAKARKAKAPKVIRPKWTELLAVRLAEVDLRPRILLNKVPFVVLVIGSLGVGLGLTLWLSTDSAERSYQLSHARERTRMLQQQKESLERDVRESESAPALAEAARKQGMIPTRDAAHLVQDPGGIWVVVGTPKPADGVPPPPLNSKLPDEVPPPPLRPLALPPEVPVRVSPGPGDSFPAAKPGPETLLRAPDDASTLRLGDQHLPTQVLPLLPGIPGPVADQVPGLLLPPGPPVSGGSGYTPVPADVPAPLDVVPVPMPAQVPAEVPVRLQPWPGAQTPQAVIAPPTLAPAPATGEQFGPVTATTPGVPR